MHDQALVWNTDATLRVTSLTARLRDFAGIGPSTGTILVSDLWEDHDPFPVLAHQWALEGETLAFEACVRGSRLHFELAPLLDPAGRLCGVGGRAIDVGTQSPLAAGALLAAEDAAGIGMWHEDLRLNVVTVSPGLRTMLGLDPAATSLDLRRYDHPADREHIARVLADHALEPAYSCDHRILCGGGRIRAVRERVRTLFDERGMATSRIGTLIDITDLKEREAELSELAMHDPLTRLPNRAALEERLAACFARSERRGERCAVLFIDLDGFKRINDERGHEYGDRVLVAVADRLIRHVRASDTVARLGGDEFVVLIDDLYSSDAAVDAARKILRSFDEPLLVGDETLRVGASIGVATSADWGSPCDLVAAADREMYAAKRNGGNGIKLATPCRAHSSPAPRPFAILESA